MKHATEASTDVSTFIVVALVIPLVYLLAGGFISQLANGKKAENWYLGVDLTLAAFVTVGLYTLEPQTRLLSSRFAWENQDVINIKQHYGVACALALNFLLLVISACIHRDFVDNHADVENPTWLQKLGTGIINGIFNNLLGVIAFFTSAYFLRG